MRKSRSEAEVNAEAEKLEDQVDYIKQELKVIIAAVTQKSKLVKKVKEEIAEINGELEEENEEVKDLRTPEEIKAETDKKILVITEKK